MEVQLTTEIDSRPKGWSKAGKNKVFSMKTYNSCNLIALGPSFGSRSA